MAELNVEPIVELVDYVQTMLNEGSQVKIIAQSLNINDQRQLK